MNKSVSKFLGFTEQEILEIVRQEKVEIPTDTSLIDELKKQHNMIVSA